MEFPSVDQTNNKKTSLPLTYPEDIKINLNLSFIKFLKKAKRYELGNKVVHIRSERVFKMYDLSSEISNQFLGVLTSLKNILLKK